MGTIPSVQVLRAIAALMIVVDHFGPILLFGDLPRPIRLLNPLASGVDLFFVISGFIMVHASEPLFGSPKARALFFTRRLGRIVPLYWATTLIAIIALPRPWSWRSLAGSLFFIPYTNFPIYFVGWTLNYEMLFYALFAGALGWSRGVATKLLVIMLAILALAGATVPGLPRPLLYWCNPLVLEFALGIGLALAFRSGLILPVWLRALMIALGTAVIWCVDSGQMPPHRALVWGIPAAMIFAGVVFGRRTGSSGLLTRVLLSLGNASYAIYLIHPLFAAGLMKLSNAGLLPYPRWLVIGIAVPSLMVLALAVYRWFERPTTRALSRLAAHRLLGGGRLAAAPV